MTRHEISHTTLIAKATPRRTIHHAALLTTLLGATVAAALLLPSGPRAAWAQQTTARPITLLRAIEIAEAHKQGRAFEAERDEDSFTPAYKVSVAVGAQVHDVRIHAQTGAVIGARLDDDRPPQHKATLAAIVRAAEAKTSGRAVEAECDDDRFEARCEVRVVTTSGSAYDVLVDSQSGRVLKTRQRRKHDDDDD